MSFDISKIILGLLVFVVGCKAQSAKTYTTFETVKDCPTIQRNYGDISICLPEIKGYLECFNDSLVKKRANEEMGLIGNEIFSVYLNSELYSKFIKAPITTKWEEHIKIYGVPSLKSKDVPDNLLDKIESHLRSNSEIIAWDITVNKINKGKIGYTLQKPALVEIYQTLKNVKSFVYISDYDLFGEPGIMMWVANICILKNRIIYVAYYKEFDNKNAKVILKKKNDFFIKELIRLNI